MRWKNLRSVFGYGSLILISIVLQSSLLGNEAMEQKYREASIKQGDIKLNRAKEFYNDRMYDQCIQTVNTFALVYPFHPQKKEAWALLSSAYKKLGNYRKSADTDLSIYMEYPTDQDGNLAYLRAGRSYVKVGEMEMAKRIFTELRENSYFPEIAQEADLELRQWSVLSGNFRQIE
ncbi:MAG: hypothetical protein JJT78_10800 [Leptospira sp.]|nr:hypothetical protein [Leptospira sp.]